MEMDLFWKLELELLFGDLTLQYYVIYDLILFTYLLTIIMLWL